MHADSTQPGPAHRSRPLAMLALAALAASLAAPARAQPPQASEPTFEAALQAYERNHWAQAFATLASLADQGHQPARRMALQMHQYGPRLYGMAFELGTARRQAWRDMPAPPLAQVAEASP